MAFRPCRSHNPTFDDEDDEDDDDDNDEDDDNNKFGGRCVLMTLWP